MHVYLLHASHGEVDEQAPNNLTFWLPLSFWLTFLLTTTRINWKLRWGYKPTTLMARNSCFCCDLMNTVEHRATQSLWSEVDMLYNIKWMWEYWSNSAISISKRG